MSSRQMETPVQVADDRLDAYRALFRGTPELLLAVGWDDPEELAGLADEVVPVPDARAVIGKGYPAALWFVEGGPPDRESVERVRGALADRGRLVLRCGADAPRREEVSGSVDELLRCLVRALSETGFVVLKEISPETLGAPAVVARRDDFVIRSYRAGDDEAIRGLFVERFPHARRTPEHWLWKYQDSPWGNRKISLAVSATGELAAHYGGYAMPFWCRGRSLLGLHIGDTMSAEAFQHVGRGTSSLLARTVRHFFAVHRRGPFAFYYGFNTGPIQRFCRWFIGGSQVEPVSYRRLELAPGPGWSVGPYRVSRVETVTGSWDRLFRRAAPAYGFLTRRDGSYVDWRYLRCPDTSFVLLAARRFGRLVAWGVFRRQGGNLLWGDALIDPRHPGAVEALLAVALERPNLSGVEAVECWSPAHPPWLHAELERLGLERSPHPQDLGMMILTDTDSETELPLEDLYYTMGDGDLF